MRRNKVRLAGVVGVVGGLSVLAIGCGQSEGGQIDTGRTPADLHADAAPKPDGLLHLSAESARYIGTESITASPDPLPLRLYARLEFRDGAVSRIGAPMAGRVSTVLVRSGERVREGDPVVVLSCPDAAAARTALATTEAALREAQATAERQDRMFEEGVGVDRERLAAEIHLESQRAEADRARAASAFIGAGQGGEVTLRAPITGVVLGVKASPGMTVAPDSESLVEIGDPDSVWVVADAPERDLPQIIQGSRATLELASIPGALPARVISIGAVVSSDLRTAPVRMALDARPAGLRPGMFGWVLVDTAAAGPTLPVEAVLIKDGKHSVVYVARDDLTFERRDVVVGREVGGRVRVVSGLSAGDRVVVRGALLLDGSAEQLL
jgi:membrane fusion protein, heavy metal efflux system